jgi:hypothetical protein
LQKIEQEKNLTKNEDLKIDYKSIMDNKIKIINELNEKVKNEIKRFVICKICKRKFANKTHLLRHSSMSELHKKNVENLLNLLEKK